MLQFQASPSRCAAKETLLGQMNVFSRSYRPSNSKQRYSCSAAGPAAPVDMALRIIDRVDGLTSRVRALHSARQHSAQQVLPCERIRGFTVSQILLFLAFGSTAACGPALAALHVEPANALSIPTWLIHISSVLEWTTAMALMWKYAEISGNERWKGMTWGMMPLFAGALSACTYHFFYNAPELDFLVAIQAGLTWIGNATLWIAAYRIYRDSQATAS